MKAGQILSEAPALESALNKTQFYPLRHAAPLPVPGGHSWQNDGQNFVFNPYDGLWRTWALGNADWQPGDGFPKTDWIEYVGPALDQLVPVGVRIDRSTCPAGSYWSGSCFVDWHNRLGRGYGAAWYYVSTPSDNGLQCMMLLVAPELGTTPHQQGIVLGADAVPPEYQDGGRDFRDCRVFWDDEHDQLVLAASCSIGFIFFSSQDGLNWQFLSEMPGPGPSVECPNLLKLPVFDKSGGNTGEKRWVILGTVQGPYTNQSDAAEACTFWVGNWDGTRFLPDAGYPLPLDYGPDSYATAAGTDHLGRPYVGYWLGNWEYCTGRLAFEGFQNVQGLPRRCWLQPDGTGTLRVFSAPLESDVDAYSKTFRGTTQTLTSGTDYTWPDNATPTGVCGRIDVTLTRVGDAWPDTVTLRFRAGKYSGADCYTELTLNGKDGTATFSRAVSGPSSTGDPASAPPPPPTAAAPTGAWGRPYRLPSALGITAGSRITLSVLLDSCSAEIFVNGGLGTIASLIFPPDSCQGLSLAASSPVQAAAIVHQY